MKTPKTKLRSGLAIGGVTVGAAAILLFGGNAGAQESPEPSVPSDIAEAVLEADEATVDITSSDYDLGEITDAVLEPDADVIAAWAAFDACYEAELGIDFETAAEDDFAALADADWDAADKACAEQLAVAVASDMDSSDSGYDFGELPEFMLEPDADVIAAWAALDACYEAELGIDFSDAEDDFGLSEADWDAADKACAGEVAAATASEAEQKEALGVDDTAAFIVDFETEIEIFG